MTDLQLLAVVFSAVYLWECTCWLRRGSVGFRTWLGRRWRPAHPSTLLGNASGGINLAWPLPPLGSFVVGSQLPFSLGSEGVLSYVSTGVNPGGRPTPRLRYWEYSQCREIRAKGKRVLINGEEFVRAGSTVLASQWAELIDGIRKEKPAKRNAAIEGALRSAIDPKAVTQRWEKFRALARPGFWLTNHLFLYLAILTPLAIWHFGFRSCWPMLLAGLLIFTTFVTFWYRRVHLEFFPNAHDERFTQCLLVLLSPATTLRARDSLSRPLLEGFHPLAVARALCAAAEFKQLAAQAVRDLTYPALPICPSPDPKAKSAEQEWREMLLREVRKLIQQAGLSPADLLAPPSPADASSQLYCPRCLSQFTSGAATCEDCGGLALKPLKP